MFRPAFIQAAVMLSSTPDPAWRHAVDSALGCLRGSVVISGDVPEIVSSANTPDQLMERLFVLEDLVNQRGPQADNAEKSDRELFLDSQLLPWLREML